MEQSWEQCLAVYLIVTKPSIQTPLNLWHISSHCCQRSETQCCFAILQGLQQYVAGGDECFPQDGADRESEWLMESFAALLFKVAVSSSDLTIISFNPISVPIFASSLVRW